MAPLFGIGIKTIKIKRWVEIIVLFSLIVAVLVTTFNYYNASQMDKSINKMMLTNEIVKVVNQRLNVANDYVNNYAHETVLQWRILTDVLVKLLLSPEFNTIEEQSILGDMREDNVHANRMFTELIVLHQKEDSVHATNNNVQATEVKNELFERSNSIVIGAYRLAEINQQESTKISRLTSRYILSSVGIMIALITFILIFIRQKIVSPLIDLNKGMKIVATGKLDFKISSTSQDEIGQMIESFNSMSTSLKERIEEQQTISHRLEKSNKELLQFAYIASHDLKEPLRRISSFLQLLEKRYKGKLDKDADEYIDFAVNGAKKLQVMIDNLLLFSRIHTRGSEFKIVNMEDAFNQAVEHLQISINESKAIITHDPLPTIKADATQMVMIFQNLLSNAIKFTNKQEVPKVYVSAHRERNAWCFSVRDNGIGMDPASVDQLFVIFKRLVGNEYPGTGIGLALCQRIVDRHGGRIWVDTEKGKGSTFYFTIPDDAG